MSKKCTLSTLFASIVAKLSPAPVVPSDSGPLSDNSEQFRGSCNENPRNSNIHIQGMHGLTQFREVIDEEFGTIAAQPMLITNNYVSRTVTADAIPELDEEIEEIESCAEVLRIAGFGILAAMLDRTADKLFWKSVDIHEELSEQH